MMKIWALSTNVWQQCRRRSPNLKTSFQNLIINTTLESLFHFPRQKWCSLWCDAGTNHLRVTFAFVWELKGWNPAAFSFNLQQHSQRHTKSDQQWKFCHMFLFPGCPQLSGKWPTAAQLHRALFSCYQMGLKSHVNKYTWTKQNQLESSQRGPRTTSKLDGAGEIKGSLFRLKAYTKPAVKIQPAQF